MSILTKLGGIFGRSPAQGAEGDDQRSIVPKDVSTNAPDQRSDSFAENETLDDPDAKTSAVKDRPLLRVVAKVMFVTKFGNATPEEMNTAWTEGKKAALDDARQLIRRLEKKGVSLSRDLGSPS